MKRFILLVIIVFCLFLCGSYQKECGGIFRWDVKVCSDTGFINPAVKPIQISKLIKNVSGRKLKRGMPRFGIEHNIYRVRCRIVDWKDEKDGDYHLVLQEVDGEVTMVGEIPDPGCSRVKGSRYLKGIKQSRQFFNAEVISGDLEDNGVYEVTGVAYFDFFHNQIGMAPSGLELHPIISIKKL